MTSLNMTQGEMNGSIDDTSALRRYAATGDPTAFEVLVHRYQAMVLATCRRTLRNDSDAEDATQEAFLKLAQHAGSITSNAAAWLHACALRASLDLLRKKGSTQRVEKKAASSAVTKPGDDAAAFADWREIEPLLDEAIARLSDADRELIVGRFLAGRTNQDLAHEAGINPGTMSRRIEKALDRLRDQLAGSGISLAGTLAAALAIGGAKVAVSSGLTGSLVKTGLVGLARRPAEGQGGGLLNSIAGKAALLTAAAVIGIGAITAGVVVTRSANSAGGSMVNSIAVSGTGVPQPTRASARFSMTSILSAGIPNGSMRIEGDTMIYEEIRDTSWQSMPEESKAVMRILDSRVEDGIERMTLRVESSDFEEWHDLSRLTGLVLDAEYEITETSEGERLRITVLPPPGVPPQVEMMEWIGTRPPAWHPEADARPTDTPLTSGLGGLWFEVEPCDLVLSERDITLKMGKRTVHRFRVINWDETARHTLVQTICADSMNPSMPGERVKILLREDDSGGYTLVMHDQYSDKLNQWPAGFGINPETTVMSFRKAKP